MTIELTDAPDENRNECDSCWRYSSIIVTLGATDDCEFYLCPECATELVTKLSSLLNDHDKLNSKKNIYKEDQP